MDYDIWGRGWIVSASPKTFGSNKNLPPKSWFNLMVRIFPSKKCSFEIDTFYRGRLGDVLVSVALVSLLQFRATLFWVRIHEYTWVYTSECVFCFVYSKSGYWCLLDLYLHKLTFSGYYGIKWSLFPAWWLSTYCPMGQMVWHSKDLRKPIQTIRYLRIVNWLCALKLCSRASWNPHNYVHNIDMGSVSSILSFYGLAPFGPAGQWTLPPTPRTPTTTLGNPYNMLPSQNHNDYNKFTMITMITNS